MAATRKSMLGLLLAASTLAGGAATAQEEDLTVLPAPSDAYQPSLTAWGEPDFRGGWPIDHLNGRTPLQRAPEHGNRQLLTQEEFADRADMVEQLEQRYQNEDSTDTMGIGHWAEVAAANRRTSWITSPADGQLPAYTAEGQRLSDAMRSTWAQGQPFDWVDDFDSWDRCVSRGFPASMYPFRYNNGIRVFQSPGYMTIVLEMLGTRVVKIYDSKEAAHAAKWDESVEAWMGNSRGWWEGKTLVIETTNIVSGDSATEVVSERSASPLNMATQFTGTLDVPAFNTVPMSTEAMTVERLTMTGPDTIIHELTYTDPKVYTQPWTTRLAWTRDDDYQFFEYACHEGNYMPRDYISASRAQQARIAAGEEDPVTAENDDRSRFAQPFDHDPGTGPRPGFGPPPPADDEEEADG